MNYGKLQLGLNRDEAAATVAACRAAAVSHAAVVWKSLESEVCVALNQVRKIMNWVFFFSTEAPPTKEKTGGKLCQSNF